VVAVAIGGAVFVADQVIRPATPASIDRHAARQFVSADLQEFDDEKSVTVLTRVENERSLPSPRGGIVTALECEAGANWTSGSFPLEIDAAPILALHLSTPPWRDLQLGDTGPDVRALQSELERLGKTVSSDGVVGDQTVRALEALLGTKRESRSEPVLARDSFVWLPSQSVTIADCTKHLGDRVTAEEPLVSLGVSAAGFQLGSIPEGLLPGIRELEIGTVIVPVGEDNSIVDEMSISMLTADPTVEASIASGGEIELTGTLRLAEPIFILAVPAGSLIGAGTDNSCVSDGSKMFPVEIVGSTLGTTLVRPRSPDSVPERVEILDAESRRTCA